MVGEWAEESSGHGGWAAMALKPRAHQRDFLCPFRPNYHHVSTFITCISQGGGYSISIIDPFQNEPVSSPSKVSKLPNISHLSGRSTDFPSSNRGVSFGLRFAELPSIYCLTSLNLLFPFLNIRESTKN